MINVTKLCKEYCPFQHVELCGRVTNAMDFRSYIMGFLCHPKTRRNSLICLDIIPVSKVCDERSDCPNMDDEKFCDDRFYCSKNETTANWITLKQLCDDFKNCVNGKDEYNSCSRGLFSSDKYLISSTPLRYTIILTAFLIAILNTYLIYGICTQLSSSRKCILIDKIIITQIAVYDVFITIYLGGIFVASTYHGDEYCKYDNEWTTSWLCSVLGVFFNSSINGSLLLIALLAGLRCCKCICTFSGDISWATIVGICSGIHLVNMLNAIIPIIPHPAIQIAFFSKVALNQKNPFLEVNATVPENVDRLHHVYHREEASTLPLDKIAALRNITNNPELFNFQYYNFYSYSTNCIQNIFWFQSSLLGYKVTYISLIAFILLTITVNYIIIAMVNLNSKKKLGTDDGLSHMLTFKASLIVISKIITWSTLLSLMVSYHVTSDYMTEQCYETLGTMFLPLNSPLNPIFHSNLFKTSAIRLWEKISRPKK